MHGSTQAPGHWEAMAALPASDSPAPATRSYADLTDAEVEEIGRTLDALREEVLADRGAARRGVHPAPHRRAAVPRGRRTGGAARQSAAAPRGGWAPPSLALSKVLDNMEIGHNVLHGQWDWMRDPRIHSSTWDWDHASAPEQWKRAHNDRHHVNTNVVGKDNDLGYGIMRVDEAQEWEPRHLAQPLLNLVNACIFEYGIAMYDLDLGEALRTGDGFSPEQKAEMRTTARRVAPQRVPRLRAAPAAVGADRVGPHHPDRQRRRQPGPQRVEPLGDHVRPLPRGRGDVRGRRARRGRRRGGGGTCGRCWVRRTSRGRGCSTCSAATCRTRSSTTSSPTCPATATARSPGPVRELFSRHGLPYNTAPLLRQVASAWHKVVRLSLPPDGARMRSRRGTSRHDGGCRRCRDVPGGESPSASRRS